jgi:hypothetical protein
MRKQNPLEAFNVLPFWILHIDKKALVSPDHVEKDSGDKGCEGVLRSQPAVVTNIENGRKRHLGLSLNLHAGPPGEVTKGMMKPYHGNVAVGDEIFWC